MKIIMDLHTHTVFTHGKSTVQQNAAAAQNAGMKILGVCEHGPRHAFFAIKDFPGLVHETELACGQSGILVLPGYEFNVLSAEGELDYYEAPLKLFGFHRGASPKSLKQTWFVARGLLSRKSMKTEMTDAIIKAIETYEIDALTHPGEYVPVDIAQIARAAARRGVALEINETHSISAQEVTLAANEGARFIISSDAHMACAIGKFPSSIKLAQSCKIEHLIINAEGYAFDTFMRLNKLEK